MRSRIRKPIVGQRSLLPDVPDVLYCRRCGRLLTGKKSVKRKYGPACYRKMQEEDDGDDAEETNDGK